MAHAYFLMWREQVLKAFGKKTSEMYEECKLLHDEIQRIVEKEVMESNRYIRIQYTKLVEDVLGYVTSGPQSFWDDKFMRYYDLLQCSLKSMMSRTFSDDIVTFESVNLIITIQTPYDE